MPARSWRSWACPRPRRRRPPRPLDAALLQLAAAESPDQPGQADTHAPEFVVVEGLADPALDGIYATDPPGRVANFDLRILTKTVADEGEESRLHLVIRRHGREHAFEMTAGEFASNGRLRTAVYASPLPGADLRAGTDVLRRAAIALSRPTIRRVTTATGWTADRTKFLVPGGLVDADGYRDDDPDPEAPRVELREEDGAAGSA